MFDDYSEEDQIILKRYEKIREKDPAYQEKLRQRRKEAIYKRIIDSLEGLSGKPRKVCKKLVDDFLK